MSNLVRDNIEDNIVKQNEGRTGVNKPIYFRGTREL